MQKPLPVGVFDICNEVDDFSLRNIRKYTGYMKHISRPYETYHNNHDKWQNKQMSIAKTPTGRGIYIDQFNLIIVSNI